MKLSLVVPCYNEAENVTAFQAAVIEAFHDCGYDYEIIYVDDGSKDATLHSCASCIKRSCALLRSLASPEILAKKPVSTPVSSNHPANMSV